MYPAKSELLSAVWQTGNHSITMTTMERIGRTDICIQDNLELGEHKSSISEQSHNIKLSTLLNVEAKRYREAFRRLTIPSATMYNRWKTSRRTIKLTDIYITHLNTKTKVT